MAEQNCSENVEDEASRQRRERRELQSTIQQLKKSINKNDKTRKKKVDSEIKALEEAFAKRWEHFNENSTTESNETSTPTQSDENPPEVRHKQETLYFRQIFFSLHYRLMKNNMYHVKHVV
jgi:hypothetical protein